MYAERNKKVHKGIMKLAGGSKRNSTHWQRSFARTCEICP